MLPRIRHDGALLLDDEAFSELGCCSLAKALECCLPRGIYSDSLMTRITGDSGEDVAECFNFVSDTKQLGCRGFDRQGELLREVVHLA